MNRVIRFPLARTARTAALVAGFALAGCQDSPLEGMPDGGDPGGTIGAVYAMTNAIGANAVVVYRRAADGTLTLADTVPTGGGGSGVQLDPTDSLGSQGALALSEDTNYLFAANTETVAEDTDHDCTEGSISAFRVGGMGGLAPTEAPIASGGLFPSSIAVRDGKVYVLNSGGPDICDGRPGFDPYPNITGFTIEAGGVLRRIPGASQRVDPGLGDGCAPAGFGDPQFDCGLNVPVQRTPST